jgi:hypothetical protein
MTTRFAEHLLTGDHASLPAAADVPQGTLYACSTHLLVYQSDGVSAWTNWAVQGGGGAPSAHATSHEDGGSDEIDVTGLSGLLADSQTPAAHTHVLTDITDAGGAAALDVGTTTGTVAAGDDSRLTDARTPLAHHTTHEDGGTDEVTLTQSQVTGLSTELTTIEDDITALQNAVAPAAQGTWLASGGGVSYISGLTFIVSAGTGYINGALVTWTGQSVTLDGADGTFDRFDAIVVNTGGTVSNITGDASASPELPDVDVLANLALTYVLVQAGATTIPVTKTAIYQEDVEWTSAVSGATFDAASTADPYAGTKSVEATTAVSGDYVEFTNGSPVSLADKKQLVFQIKSKGAFPSGKSLALRFYSGTSKVGVQVQLVNGNYGFVDTNTTSYQQIVIPITDFAVAAGQTVTKIQFVVRGGSSSLGFFMDDIFLDSNASSVIVQPVATASASVSGTVKTDITEGDPVVYTKTTMDTLLAAKASTSHHTSHESGGGDTIKLDDLAAPDNNTDLDADSSTHGLLAKLGSDGQRLKVASGAQSWIDEYYTIPFVVGDGTNVVSTGVAGSVISDVAGTITAITVLSIDSTSGDIVFDIWQTDYSGAPPTVTDTIIDTGGGGVKPTLSGATKTQDTTLAHYTTTIAAGDVITVNVDSAATVKLVGLYITVKKS